jgi:hypothetical protein
MWDSKKWFGLLAAFGLLAGVNCGSSTTGIFGDVGGSGGEIWGGASSGGNAAGQGGIGGAGGGTNSTGGSGGAGAMGGEGGGINPTGGGGKGGEGGGGPIDECTSAARLVYVLTDQNQLYSFNPGLKVFAQIGTLNCNTTMLPNSMAVDRSAIAWVNFVDQFDSSGAIYKVNMADASCAASPAVTLPTGWYRIGMGFSSNGAGSTDETLYVASINGNGLGKINASNTLVPIAAFSPSTFATASAELTGTGNGNLFAYFQTSTVQVGQINKTTAAVTNPRTITGLAMPQAWAFSIWAGSFYLFSAGASGNSNVTKYDPQAGTIDNAYMTNVGFRIVGAGVSTCAPVK